MNTRYLTKNGAPELNYDINYEDDLISSSRNEGMEHQRSKKVMTETPPEKRKIFLIESTSHCPET